VAVVVVAVVVAVVVVVISASPQIVKSLQKNFPYKLQNYSKALATKVVYSPGINKLIQKHAFQVKMNFFLNFVIPVTGKK